MLRLSHVFCLPESSSTDLSVQVRSRIVESIHFIRRSCKQLVHLCLNSSAIEYFGTTSKKPTGVQRELKRHREVLRGMIIEICQVSFSGSVGTYFLLNHESNHLCLTCQLHLSGCHNSSVPDVSTVSRAILSSATQLLSD